MFGIITKNVKVNSKNDVVIPFSTIFLYLGVKLRSLYLKLFSKIHYIIDKESNNNSDKKLIIVNLGLCKNYRRIILNNLNIYDTIKSTLKDEI